MTDGLKISFSTHALYQIQERKISREEVAHAIRHPVRITHQLSYRTRIVAPFPKNPKQVMIVIYEIQPRGIVVVTAFRTSKIKKYL
ncbi:MAG: DUF4258 domain-containing protein [Candidatus Liptonbacteria bacterium]|nr:DUF4258 domain-containing protein [Candidatus Liptonbacteria bacterium]